MWTSYEDRCQTSLLACLTFQETGGRRSLSDISFGLSDCAHTLAKKQVGTDRCQTSLLACLTVPMNFSRKRWAGTLCIQQDMIYIQMGLHGTDRGHNKFVGHQMTT